MKFGGNCEVVNICENLGTSGNIWEHLGTSRNILEHLGTLIRLDRNTQSYMWIGWIGSLKHLHTRAPLCGANNILPLFVCFAILPLFVIINDIILASIGNRNQFDPAQGDNRQCQERGVFRKCSTIHHLDTPFNSATILQKTRCMIIIHHCSST